MEQDFLQPQSRQGESRGEKLVGRLPLFPPLFPSGNWWCKCLSARLAGLPVGDAISAANARSGLRRREWMRFTVSGDAVLSLPVSGGASALKNGTPSSWATSREAERDARKILHTLATLYGRTPFHALLAPLLFAPIESCFSGPRVCRTLCMEAFEAVSGVLGIGDEDFLSTFRDALLSQDHLGPVINEMRASMHARWSIIDLLMRLGPDAIFALVPSFYLNKL